MAIVGLGAAATGEDAVRALLLSRLDGAYRLATCILRDAAAAEDAVQEAALRAWAMRRGLRDPDRAEAWFARIVVNECRAELARRSRRPAVSEADLVVARTNPEELRDEVARALARLTPDEQVVVAMRFGRDLTVPQIALQTGIREGTVKSRLHNAQEHLRAAEAERRAEEAGHERPGRRAHCARTTNRSRATRPPASRVAWRARSTRRRRLWRRVQRGGLRSGSRRSVRPWSSRRSWSAVSIPVRTASPSGVIGPSASPIPTASATPTTTDRASRPRRPRQLRRRPRRLHLREAGFDSTGRHVPVTGAMSPVLIQGTPPARRRSRLVRRRHVQGHGSPRLPDRKPPPGALCRGLRPRDGPVHPDRLDGRAA